MIKSEVKFKVRFIAKHPHDSSKRISGIESEQSYFLVDQQGNMYEYSPMRPIVPINDLYLECEPLIKIGEEWLSIKEIEKKCEIK